MKERHVFFGGPPSQPRYVGGASAPLTGQITWAAGLGAITHILGPTDQNLAIYANASRNLVLGSNNAANLTLNAGALSWSAGLGAITHVTGPTDQSFVLQAATSRSLVLGSGGAANLTLNAGALSWSAGLGAITQVTGPSDQDFKVFAPASRALQLGAGGSARLTISSAGVPTVGGPGTFILDGSTANELRTGGASDLQLTAGASALGRIIFQGNAGGTEYAQFTTAGNLSMTAVGKGLEFFENGTTDLAAGAVNTGRLYVRDDGAGKTQLCVRFNTGAVQVLATEP